MRNHASRSLELDVASVIVFRSYFINFVCFAWHLPSQNPMQLLELHITSEGGHYILYLASRFANSSDGSGDLPKHPCQNMRLVRTTSHLPSLERPVFAHVTASIIGLVRSPGFSGFSPLQHPSGGFHKWGYPQSSSMSMELPLTNQPFWDTSTPPLMETGIATFMMGNLLQVAAVSQFILGTAWGSKCHDSSWMSQKKFLVWF